MMMMPWKVLPEHGLSIHLSSFICRSRPPTNGFIYHFNPFTYEAPPPRRQLLAVGCWVSEKLEFRKIFWAQMLFFSLFFWTTSEVLTSHVSFPCSSLFHADGDWGQRPFASKDIFGIFLFEDSHQLNAFSWVSTGNKVASNGPSFPISQTQNISFSI